MKKLIIWITLAGAAITLVVMFFTNHSSTESMGGKESVMTNYVHNQQTERGDRESFVLHPGQGRIVTINYKRVVWKTAGGHALVRERDQKWYGEWKRDLPGIQTPFDFSASDAIEFWVPKNFPNPVTIVINRL